jgi:hypothetical protein
MTEREQIHAGWGELSPFAAIPAPTRSSDLETEGPVRQLLMSGERDDGGWGFIGAFWLSIDGQRGGFIVSPGSLWHGSEMVRSYRGALARGWTEERIFSYWEGQAGTAGTYMIDPEAPPESLFQVARRVGAL